MKAFPLAFAFTVMLALPVAGQTNAPATNAAAGMPPPEWPVSTAPARFVIEPNFHDPTLMGYVRLFMPDPNWDGLPIRVFNEAGDAVGSDAIWSAPGEPVTLVFDTSSRAKIYKVYLASNWPPMHVPDPHFGVWLETRAGDGKVITKSEDMLDAWAKSTTVLGRAMLPGIFEGGNRFGPQDNLFLHFQGWLQVDKPEHIDFAQITVDSSFLLVDGKDLVDWPGQHDWGYGPQGPPHAGVDLTPGVHVVDLYNAYTKRDGGRPPVLDVLSVNGGPYQNWTVLAPDKPLFRPVMEYHTLDYQLRTDVGGPNDHTPPLAFQWDIDDDSPIYTDYNDLGLVGLKFHAFAPKGKMTWTFDDGTTQEGQDIIHVFARPGQRPVQLTVTDDTGKVTGPFTRMVAVHLRWSPIVHQEPELSNKQKDVMRTRDPAAMSAPDMAGLFAVFGAFHKTEDLIKLGPQMSAKMKDVKDDDLPFLRDAVQHLIHDDRDHYEIEEQLLRALIDRTAASTAPPLVAVANVSRLQLAQILIKMTEPTDEVRKLTDAIQPPALTGNEPRSLDILRGDLLLANGDIEGARKKYQDLTGDPQGADARSSIRRTARIGQARAFLDRKDYEAAEDALREVSWQAPIEKLAPDWALTRLKLYEEEGLPLAAYIWAKRLMPVIINSGRTELLYRLTDLAFAQKDDALAHKALDELMKKHPYSEEAAKAKEKWPQGT